MKYITSWSGGKDSTASIILEHIHDLPPSDIIFSEVMFDKKRGISVELPEHIDFVKNKAIPIFESWGHKVEIFHADKDYLDCFYHIVTQSKTGRNGKTRGFPIGGMCVINDRCTIPPIRQYIKQNLGADTVQYVGIAADESVRLERFKGTDKISLLAKYEYTEKMCLDLCKEFGLLSPIYEHCKRGGCWFCPNQSCNDFARLKVNYSSLWGELEKLSHAPNLVSQGFKYSKTFAEVDREVDRIISEWEFEKNQIRLFEWKGSEKMIRAEIKDKGVEIQTEGEMKSKNDGGLKQ